MTLINCIAGAVYTKGFPFKEKLQLYGMAFLFLILLYNSPSGLVLYWTLNNIFSLLKNIYYKIKSPYKMHIFLYLLAFFLLCIAGFINYNHRGSLNLRIAVSAVLLICAAALCAYTFFAKRVKTHNRSICRKHIRFGACSRRSVHPVEIPQIENRYDTCRSRFRFDMYFVFHQYDTYRFGIQNACFI